MRDDRRGCAGPVKDGAPNITASSQRIARPQRPRPLKRETDIRVYSYVVAYDSGFSPNPFHGTCTLACCKPQIRLTAQAGDLIVGLSKRSERVVYAMQIARVMDFAEYWNDPQFARKRPEFKAAQVISRCGDNIYEPWGIGEFRQWPSSHSYPDGKENIESKQTDLGGLHVLIAEEFAYYGQDGPKVPDNLAFLGIGRGHRCRFSDEEIAEVAAWFETLPRGVLGRPALWPAHDDSWRQA